MPRIERCFVRPAALVALLLAMPAWAQDKPDRVIEIKPAGDGRLAVTVNGESFTQYIFKGRAKPVLYPVLGPGGVRMTRQYPIEQAAEGEAKDHPHHASLWYTHGDVNGVDFWSVKEGAGKIVAARDPVVTGSGTARAAIRAANQWVDKNGKPILSDLRVIGFSADGQSRTIDYTVTLQASEGADVTFNDTKEGSMGIRTHPALRLKGKVAKGHALNDRGDKDGDLWGKRARWVDYWAPIDGKTVGVAIFDHPKNPRHPTYWHARDYGLVAANPYGVHDFTKKKAPKGAGNMVIKAGQSATFRYRFVFHEGDVKQADVAGRYKAFAAEQ